MALHGRDNEPERNPAEDLTLPMPDGDDSQAPTLPPADAESPGRSAMADESLPEWSNPGLPSPADPAHQTGPTHVVPPAQPTGEEPTIGYSDASANQPPPTERDTLILDRMNEQSGPSAATEQTRVLGGGAPSAGTAPTVSPQAGGGEPTPAKSKKKSSMGADSESLVGATLDGYYIEKLLGAGGMGAVFLAHQLSLDRKVAFKVLPARFASNPGLLARFTREALSAAHLTHHNVIQVFDVGCVGDTYYISMEYVRGTSLGDMIRRDGPLNVDDAAAYILQACRGLAYAHSRGVIHRDIKPDNIMVNEHGVVKIADLGLAKMTTWEEKPEGLDHDADAIMKDAQNPELTRANIAMGTPAYMSPEQARDTASVDPRSDQYSLACTLYYLCAGRAPYSGTTAFELMSKHMKEPLTPLDVHVKGVPPTFKHVIERMLAKNPEDRYPSLKETARDLEDYLGIGESSGPFKPRDAHVEILESSQKEYYAAPSLKKRKFSILGFCVLMPLLFLVSVAAGWGMFAAAVLLLTLLTPVTGFAINGTMQKTQLFRRVRTAVLRMPWKQWALTVLATIFSVLILWLLGLFFPVLGLVALATGAAVAYQLFVVRPLIAERRTATERAEGMIRELRMRGLSEEAVQDFFGRFSGVHWQEYFEEFFPYEEMLHQRIRMAQRDKMKSRKRWATWRDPLVRWLDKVEEARRVARDTAHLAAVETERLKAEGMNEEDAKAQAGEEASKLVGEALLKAADEDIVRKHRRSIPLPFNWIFRFARLAVGFVVTATTAFAFTASRGIYTPPDIIASVGRLLYSTGYTIGTGMLTVIVGLGTGLLLMFSAFSRSVIGGIVAGAGAGMVILAKALPEFLGRGDDLNSGKIAMMGLALLLVGAITCLFGGGKK